MLDEVVIPFGNVSLYVSDELERLGYYDRLKDLVEDTYRRNGNTKVTIVAHSMGGPVSLYCFTKFNGIDQAWKNRFIHAYVPLSAAWNGAVQTLQAVISGKTFSGFFSFVNRPLNDILVPIARTLESFPWLIPTSSVFGDKFIVSTPSKNYTANDYEDLFEKIGYTNGYLFFERVQLLLKHYPNPNVRTYCYYGVHVPTPNRLIYNKDFRPGVTIGLNPRVVNGDGDGTVHIESLSVCRKWSGVTVKTYSGFKHHDMVKKTAVLDDIAKIVNAPKKKSWGWR